MYAVYEGPRCLRWLTRFAWGRRRLKRFYTLRHMATMQNALNLAWQEIRLYAPPEKGEKYTMGVDTDVFSDLVDKL